MVRMLQTTQLKLFRCGPAAAFLIAQLICAGSAAASAPPSGISLSPAYRQLTVSVNTPMPPVEFSLTNNKTVAQTFDFSVEDFNTLGDTGGLFFVGSNPTALQKKYGLAKWASLPVRQITAAPSQTVTVKVNISNPADLSPGGHYGALMIAIDNNGQGLPAAHTVALNPVASALMFVTKLGGDTHRLELTGVTFSRTLFSLPTSAGLKFQNTGNTHVVPRGAVTVSGPGGQIVSKGIINENSEIILPETSRLYTVPITQIATALWPERYHVRVEFRFDGYGQYRVYQASFIHFPLLDLFALTAVLAAILAIWRFVLYLIDSQRR